METKLGYELKEIAERKQKENKKAAELAKEAEIAETKKRGKERADELIPTLAAECKREAKKGNTAYYIPSIHLGDDKMYRSDSYTAYEIEKWATTQEMHVHRSEGHYDPDMGYMPGHITICWDSHKNERRW